MRTLAPVGNYIVEDNNPNVRAAGIGRGSLGAEESSSSGINSTAIALSIGAWYLAPSFVKPEQKRGAQIIASVLTLVFAKKLFAK